MERSGALLILSARLTHNSHIFKIMELMFFPLFLAATVVDPFLAYCFIESKKDCPSSVIESKHLVDANPFAITEKTPYSNNKANAMRCSSFISSYDTCPKATSPFGFRSSYKETKSASVHKDWFKSILLPRLDWFVYRR